MPKILQSILFLLLILVPSSVLAVCPDLSAFYPGDDPDWVGLEQRLLPLLPECLESAEYFALLGAAQLNNGDVAESLETLERALLLQPDYGAAQIDYSQALFLQGQLFPALELNEQLLARDDLPPNLVGMLQGRQESWQALTAQRTLQLELLAGYDNNLNSAPDINQITLTLSGDSVVLPLADEFRSKSGPYLNFRLAGAYRRLAPLHQHNWQLDARGRVSEDSDSDLLQLESRYTFIRPDRRNSFQVSGGLSHLLFGGNSLYTATEINSRYLPDSNWFCRPYYGLDIQHQIFDDDNSLNGLEGKVSTGMNCPYNSPVGPQQVSIELGLLKNNAMESDRPGGNRGGWQVNATWQISTFVGNFLGQLNHTSLEDESPYNILLANGADRWIDRSYLLLQYRKQISPRAMLLVNLFRQHQRSNIELFRSRDTTAEIGFSLAL